MTELNIRAISTLAIMCLASVFVPASARAQINPQVPEADASKLYPGKAYSPYAQRAFPSNVYWGETHLHTGLSLDAGLFGNTLTPDDAYRLARGEEIKEAQEARDNAERAFARQSNAYRERMEQAQYGLTDIVEHLPPASALVSFTLYQPTTTSGGSDLAQAFCHGCNTRIGEFQPVQ